MPTYLTPGVYVEEIDTGSKPLASAATAVAAFVGFTERAPLDDPDDPDGLRPRLVTSWSQFTSLYGGFVDGAMLPHAVNGFFVNGGSLCYIVRVAHTRASGTPTPLELPSANDATKPAMEITAKDASAGGVTVEVEPGPIGDTFNLRVRSGDTVLETHTDLTLTKGADRNAETVVSQASSYVTVKVRTTAKSALPAAGAWELARAEVTSIEVGPAEFSGDVVERTGIAGLSIADDVTMVAVPDLITAARKADGTVDLDLWRAVQGALLDHCDGQANRMAILDAPPGMRPQQLRDWRSDVARYDSMFGALYYPWLKVSNPLAGKANGSGPASKMLTVPPCGHLAGLWSRNDATRGVWKAPANEIVRGVMDVDLVISKEEQGLLNPIGVNCIRPFGTRGIRVWGARTLSSDASWTYINVRRLFNMIETTIMDGTQWVVFEPNDMALWERVRRTITAYLRGLWHDGALFGATPEEAFFVKCDAETNPQDSIDLGRLIVEVGVAPVKPAEFVIFRVSQFQGGSAAAE